MRTRLGQDSAIHSDEGKKHPVGNPIVGFDPPGRGFPSSHGDPIAAENTHLDGLGRQRVPGSERSERLPVALGPGS